MTWQGIILHHTASHDSDVLDLESIRDYHTRERGWSDIGYHWVVEHIDGHPVAVMGRPSDRVGAHALNFNTTHLGVAVVGNFSESFLPTNVRDTLVDLLSSLCAMNGIRPSQRTIRRHRDVKATQCPGGLFPYEEIVAAVADRVEVNR